MTRQDYTERFCTPSAPGGCTTLMLIEIVRLEAEVERLKQSSDEWVELAQESTAHGETEPDWHNPDGVESPGYGYRFCIQGETRKDATHWFNGLNGWISTNGFGGGLCRGTTYRTNKPLPKP